MSLRDYGRAIAPRAKPQNERRRALEYAIDELNFRQGLLVEMAPATDNPEYMMWKVRALQLATAALRRPHFEVSPFV